MKQTFFALMILVGVLVFRSGPALAEDVPGVQEHPLVSRYPGQEIRWQEIENHRPYRVPVGEVTGYRTITDWIDTEGLVTRTFYRYEGSDRTYSEMYLNYLQAFEAQGFEILARGNSTDRKGVAIGSRRWLEVHLAENAINKAGEVGTMAAGTSSSGGAAALVARKERATGTVYAVLVAEQHSATYVGVLIDIVEVQAAQTGLVSVDAEAIGAAVLEYGRVVLSGLYFEYDQAVLTPDSDPVLEEMAAYLAGRPQDRFYVVGHTDSRGTFAYNQKLSLDRARAVVSALKDRHGVQADQLEPHGVGPLVPVFSNASDAGRKKNRRVELVER